MRLEEAEVDFLFLCEGANVKYVSRYVESLFDADQRFDGRVVKFSYMGEKSNHELTAFKGLNLTSYAISFGIFFKVFCII